MKNDLYYILAGFIGLLLTLYTIRFRNSLSDKLKIWDHPDVQPHKVHARSTPLVGGLAVIPAVVIVLLAQSIFDTQEQTSAKPLIVLGVATLFSFMVGLIDDRQRLPALQRLCICGMFFSVTLGIAHEFFVSALHFQTLGVSVQLGLMAVPFSVTCVLALQNAFNMVDGRNGLAIGLAIIWLVTLLSFGAHPTNLAVFVLLLGLLTIAIPNWRGVLFLGDSGSYAIGAFLGLTTTWIHQSNIGLHTADVLTLFAIPIFDTTRLLVRRLLNGRSPFAADRDHLHNHLDDAYGWPRGCWIYFAMVALPILLFRLDVLPLLYGSLAAFIVYVVGYLYVGWHLPRRRAMVSGLNIQPSLT